MKTFFTFLLTALLLPLLNNCVGPDSYGYAPGMIAAPQMAAPLPISIRASGIGSSRAAFRPGQAGLGGLLSGLSYGGPGFGSPMAPRRRHFADMTENPDGSPKFSKADYEKVGKIWNEAAREEAARRKKEGPSATDNFFQMLGQQADSDRRAHEEHSQSWHQAQAWGH